LPDGAVGARQRIEIAVERDVPALLDLIEIDRVAADRRRRSEIPRGDLTGRSAAGADAIQRRKPVRVDRGVDDVWRAAGAREAIETRSVDREALVCQTRDRRVRRRRRRHRQARFEVTPQIAE
jgi:hypothetical protein